jgi:Methyltransferase domain
MDRSRIRKALGLRCLEDYTVEERRAMWPPAKMLRQDHLRNCRLVENRDVLLSLMPKNSVVAEVGIDQCLYSEKILNITTPTTLHLVDIAESCIAIAQQKFRDEINRGIVRVHKSDSSTFLKSLPDQYLDWVYIDGDHSYSGVKKDLEAVRVKIKSAGHIALNDYIYFSASELLKYGVIEAVNEFCLEYGYELLFLAFNVRQYNDVVLRKM